MALFRRKRSTGHEAPASGDGDATRRSENAENAEVVEVDTQAPEQTDDQVPVSDEPVLGSHRADELGPFDSGDVPRPEGFLDLGSLWLPNVPGVTLMVEADQNTQEVTALRVQIASSVLQLQVFAAPKSENLWGEIREEIAEGLKSGGGSALEAKGPYGDELMATVPAGSGSAVMRFLGVDGPRWFLRGVISGPAATDESLAKPFIDLLRVVVVHRGDGPMAPRELLPMHMPKNIEAAESQLPDGAIDYEAELSPFERGPEITEIR